MEDAVVIRRVPAVHVRHDKAVQLDHIIRDLDLVVEELFRGFHRSRVLLSQRCAVEPADRVHRALKRCGLPAKHADSLGYVYWSWNR